MSGEKSPNAGKNRTIETEAEASKNNNFHKLNISFFFAKSTDKSASGLICTSALEKAVCVIEVFLLCCYLDFETPKMYSLSMIRKTRISYFMTNSYITLFSPLNDL